MAEAATVAGAASIAALGMQAGGSIMKGQGTKAADDFQADRAQRAAAFGEIQANLTDTTARENLNTTLGNIEAIRAAGKVDPSSPTTQAILDQNRERSDRQRTAAVASIKAQSAEDLASADYLRKAGDFAVTQSYLSAGTDIASGVAKGYSRGGAFRG